MIRLAHIESSLNWGGQELRIVEQSQWLNEQGHPTWIIGRPGAAILDKARERDLPHLELALHGSAHPLTLSRLLGFLRRNQIQVLDCHGSRDAFYGAYVKALTSVRVIRSRHVTNRIRAKGLHGLVWRRGNHGIITTAHQIKRMLLEQRLAREEDILVAAPGVDPGRFSAHIDSGALKQRLGIPADHKVVANIGMIRRDKGQRYFVECCRRLLEQGLPVTCIQVGDATGASEPYKADVLQLCGEHLDRGIRFLGYHDDIENYLALADVVVIASINTEAQTRLVPQAFFMGKNVVATTTGGLPEMIRHGETGLLCPARDPGSLAAAVTQLLEKRDMAREIALAARRDAYANMTFAAMMEQMLDFYRSRLGS